LSSPLCLLLVFLAQLGCVDPEGTEPEVGEDASSFQKVEQALTDSNAPLFILSAEELESATRQPWDDPASGIERPSQAELDAMFGTRPILEKSPAHKAKKERFAKEWKLKEDALRGAGHAEEVIQAERAKFKSEFFAQQ